MRPNIPLAIALLAVASESVAQRQSLQDAAWLTGCWELKSDTRRVVERWQASGSEMTGNSRTWVNGVDREGEMLRLLVDSDTLVYAAHPGGQAPTRFRAKIASPNELVFENLTHDFPQRILYRKVGADSVVARIEGDRAGRRSAVDYPYRRIDCATEPESPLVLITAAMRPLYADMVTREMTFVGGVNAWYVQHAAPDFELLIWASPGSQVPVGTLDNIRRAAASMQANAARATQRDRRYEASVQRIRVAGDTAEVLVSSRYRWNFDDTQGRYGPAGVARSRDGTQRRIDRWIRIGDVWKLKRAEVIGDEILIDGRLVSKDGYPVPRD
jgi:hypothetical protein